MRATRNDVFINNRQQVEAPDHKEEANMREMLNDLNRRLCYLNGIDERMTSNAVFYADGIWVRWALANSTQYLNPLLIMINIS